MKNKRIDGFTLVELMIVVAIISIFSTMAIPNFQNRIIQTQIKESFNITEPFKEVIENYHTKHGRFPSNNQEAGIPEPDKLVGNYVRSVEWKNGTFHVYLGNRINAHVKNKVLSIRPALVPNSPQSPLAWLCGNAEAVDGMEAAGTNETDVIRQYLPIECRSWK